MKNYISSRTTNLIVSISGGLTIWMLLIMCYKLAPTHSVLSRIFQIMGGTTDGYIQMLTYIAFVLGFLEIAQKERQLKSEYAGFDLYLLPIDNDTVISKSEVSNISNQINHMERHGQNSLLASIVKKVCFQYTASQSINDTLQLIDTKIQTSKQESEGQLEIVRYVLFAISSLGFVGTVIGLSEAIGRSSEAHTPEGIASITQFFHLAFDTTLVALVLNLILNYVYHLHLEHLESFYSKSKTYIVDNLICRIV